MTNRSTLLLYDEADYFGYIKNYFYRKTKAVFNIGLKRDNRIGCTVSLRVMEKLKRRGHGNIFVGGGSAQAEVGCRCAKTLGKMSEAEIGFSLDIGTADGIDSMPKEGIPCQVSIMKHGGTDASVFQTAN